MLGLVSIMANTINIYFDPAEDGDLVELINKLKKLDPKYARRSRSGIGKMLLIEKLREELEKHERNGSGN
jgi:hypothetical protein